MTFTVEVEFLSGRYTATHYDDRNRAEWPPHPARLFSALVATWADADDPDPAERSVIAWLETLGAPEIACSRAAERAVLTHYVPVNDARTVRDLSALYDQIGQARAQLSDSRAAKPDRRAERNLERLQDKARSDSAKAVSVGEESAGAVANGLAMLPESRGRQGRTFPTVRPDEPRVQFVWPDAAPTSEERAALDGLLRRIVRLGHSSSQVACRLIDETPTPTLAPAVDGRESLRVPAAGLLNQLEREYGHHQGREPRVLPAAVARYQYVSAAVLPPPPEPLLGGEWLVLARREGSSLSVRRALAICTGVRGALQHHADQPVPEVISGHLPGHPGERTPASSRPHLALVALPFVGSQYADGSVLGVALVLPKQLADNERRAVLTALGRWRNADRDFPLVLGSLGDLRLVLTDELETRRNLLRETWCHPATTWGSVTPVALDRFAPQLFAADRQRREAAEAATRDTIIRSCAYAGFPAPVDVTLSRAPLVLGAPPLRDFPPYRSPSGTVTRSCVHVGLRFDQPVRGPMLIGAGRYLGYGLCRPLDGDGNSAD